jgi:hypothetical protein
MTAKVPVLAGVTEAATSNVEASGFCDYARSDEEEGEPTQNEHSSAMEEAQNKSKAAEDFQPRKVEGQSYANCPWQHFIVIDVVSEANRVHRFDDAGINENATDDKSANAPKDIARGKVHFLQEKQTPNVQAPTPNAQWQNQIAASDVEC